MQEPARVLAQRKALARVAERQQRGLAMRGRRAQRWELLRVRQTMRVRGQAPVQRQVAAMPGQQRVQQRKQAHQRRGHQWVH